MKRLLSFLMVACASTAGAAPFNLDPMSSVPVLVPFSPSQQLDGYGARWSIALLGYNSADTDIVIPLQPESDPLRNARNSVNFLRMVGR